MKQSATRHNSAFTLIEMCVVVTVLALLAAMILITLRRTSGQHAPTACENNLKEIGIAYRLWSGDCGDSVPSQAKIKQGGWQDLLTNVNQGPICWTNFALLANDLGQTPRLVVCPSDNRTAAVNLTNGLDNSHLSYFVGVGANDVYPDSIEGGDRNLGSGTKPDPEYGYSPTNGQGNDVIIPTTGPVSWSLKMHTVGNPAGVGNILFGDGSVQRTTNASLNQKWLANAQDSGNWPSNHVPTSPSIRLVFP